jgi:hypothetical protein
VDSGFLTELPKEIKDWKIEEKKSEEKPKK